MRFRGDDEPNIAILLRRWAVHYDFAAVRFISTLQNLAVTVNRALRFRGDDEPRITI